MNRLLIIFIITAVSFCLFNCRSSNQSIVDNGRGDSLAMQDLDCCDDFRSQVIHLDPDREVIILVHGCKASTGRFSTLKDVFESRGQQAVCFSYDYRKSIEDCSRQLLEAVNSLNDFLKPPQITIVGHSQGGLVARRALVLNRSDNLALEKQIVKIRLVTISSPFNGIEASSHCGITALHIASAGITALICQAIAGSTWNEINPRADLINNPGEMSDRVYQHLKINTDEQDTCRSFDIKGNCVESDNVFVLGEQYTDVIDEDTRVLNVELNAGHAEVVGSEGKPPFKLIQVLEEFSILEKDTRLSQHDENALLARLYQ